MRIPNYLTPLLLIISILAPLHGQIDPRLAMETDSLDVFKEINRKPQVVTVLDMSGSMTAMTCHSRYSTNANQNTNLETYKYKLGETPKDDYRVVLACEDGDSIEVKKGHTFDGRTYDVSVVFPRVIDLTYRNRRYEDSWIDMTGVLVHAETQRPFDADNIELPTASITMGLFRDKLISGNSITFYPSLEAFVRLSSHSRIKGIKANREVDLPIPWKLWNAEKSNGLSQDYVYDDYSGLNIPVDTTHLSIDKKEIAGHYDGKRFVISGDGEGSALFDYNADYLAWIFSAKDKKGSFFVGTATDKPGWSNGLPGMTRCQANKLAVIKVWQKLQHKVQWAYRYLDVYEQGANLKAENGTDTKDNRTLQLLKPFKGEEIPNYFTSLAAKRPSWSTPLATALANTYVQLAEGAVFDNKKGFNEECVDLYVILFTDGQANDSKTVGYADGTALGKADPFGAKKNEDVKNWLSGFNSNTLTSGAGGCFNTWTLAGLAAHGSHQNEQKKYLLETDENATSIKDRAPFGVKTRASVTYDKFKNISTLTVGVGLAGDHKEKGSPKRDLLLTAGYGDSSMRSWDQETFVPTVVGEADDLDEPGEDGQSSTSGNVPVRFYDAKSPNGLVTALAEAMENLQKGSSSFAAPVAPMVGLRSGRQIYLGTFNRKDGTPTMWPGDLFGVTYGIINKKIKLYGKNGTEIQDVPIDRDSAMWSFADALKAQIGPDAVNRKVYTYFDAPTEAEKAGNPHKKGETPRTLKEGKYLFTDANNDLIDYISGKTTDVDLKDTIKKQINWMRGVSRGANEPLMGDIINSSPIVFEYAQIPSGFTKPENKDTPFRFRVIFVGTNHGFLHAVGELSYDVKKDGKTSPYSEVKELWSFIPKDFLKSKNLKNQPVLGAYQQLKFGKEHVYMVDGPMVGYLNEDQSTKGLYQVVDSGTDEKKDVAMLVFRLGKGGRSVYALNVTDIESPELAWAVIPDDSSVKDGHEVISKMGLSTGIPSLSRVLDTATDTKKASFKDLIFLNGGLSSDGIDSAFSAQGELVKLGRSILAVETLTGEIYESWDLLNDYAGTTPRNIGSVPAAAIPVETLKQSKMTQRVYFADRSGGVFALGSNAIATSDEGALKALNEGKLVESSDPKVWKKSDKNGLRLVGYFPEGEVITTSPTPFRLRDQRNWEPIETKMPSLVVGVAVGTGDYWDPMDLDVSNPNLNHTFAVMFDRNDNMNPYGITKAEIGKGETRKLKDEKNWYSIATKVKSEKPSVNPGDTSEPKTHYFEKNISEALVLRKALYFPLFDPASDSAFCGGGVTRVFRIGNVVNPVWKDAALTSGSSSSESGEIFVFSRIAGRLTAFSSSLMGAFGNLLKDKGDKKTGEGIQAATDYQPGDGPAVRMTSWRIVR